MAFLSRIVDDESRSPKTDAEFYYSYANKKHHPQRAAIPGTLRVLVYGKCAADGEMQEESRAKARLFLFVNFPDS